eukprot:5927418-Amphidinium_carterae.1
MVEGGCKQLHGQNEMPSALTSAGKVKQDNSFTCISNKYCCMAHNLCQTSSHCFETNARRTQALCVSIEAE